VGVIGVLGDVAPVAAVIVQDVLMADIEVIDLADDEDAVEVVGNAVYMNAAPVDWLLQFRVPVMEGPGANGLDRL
jgi:hypothetical protein